MYDNTLEKNFLFNHVMWWSGSVLQSHEVFAKQSGGQENPPSPLLGATGNREAAYAPGLILADALFASLVVNN
jgi:hypothetical protein